MLSARSQGSNVESVIQNARRSGRVTAAEVPYLRALGKTARRGRAERRYSGPEARSGNDRPSKPVVSTGPPAWPFSLRLKKRRGPSSGTD
ncbi:hypothetical protein ACFFW8_11700 [Erwinia tracheiphila]